MKKNSDKCQLIVRTDEASDIQMEDSAIKRSNHEKFQVSKLTIYLMQMGMQEVCAKKESSKLYTLARITPYMEMAKRKSS